MFAPSYERRRNRECANCGHYTNVHHDCDCCECGMCENCELIVVNGKSEKHFCSEPCMQEVCQHNDVHTEVYEESNGASVSSVELFFCRDCGARVDEDREIVIGRAA